jgi:SSS family solute:Na+ symporter
MALCAGIVGAQVGGIGLVFEVFLGMSKLYGILIGCGIVIAYSTVGGMKAVIYTDVIQFIVLVIGLPITLILGVMHVGGWSTIVEAVPTSHFTLLGPKTWVAFISLFLTFLLGETLVPPYVQRLLIGKNTQETAKGTYASGLLSIPFFLITGAIGLVAYTMDASIDPNTAMPYVIHNVLPIGLKGIVVMGIVSIVMSSADSFLNGASVAFVNDIVQPLRGEKLSDALGLRWVMGTNLIVGLASVWFALSIPSILDILIYAYNFWAPTILVPLAWTILGFSTSTRAMVVASLLGGGCALAWNHLYQEAFGLDGLVVGTLTNALIMFLFHAFSSKKGVTP